MGDPACYREYCPACDRELTIVDAECPECGTSLEKTTSETGSTRSERHQMTVTVSSSVSTVS